MESILHDWNVGIIVAWHCHMMAAPTMGMFSRLPQSGLNGCTLTVFPELAMILQCLPMTATLARESSSLLDSLLPMLSSSSSLTIRPASPSKNGGSRLFSTKSTWRALHVIRMWGSSLCGHRHMMAASTMGMFSRLPQSGQKGCTLAVLPELAMTFCNAYLQ